MGQGDCMRVMSLTKWLTCKEISDASGIGLGSTNKALGKLYDTGYIFRRLKTYNKFEYKKKE